MFRKIVSNLAFSPALVGQLGFYAKRLRKEEATRRIGLIFTALALVVQSFAVFSPPESANAANPSDFIRGGVSSLSEYVSHYDQNSNNIKDILGSLGISRAEIKDAKQATINSKDVYSWGMTSHFSSAQGEGKYAYEKSNGSSGNVYYRPLSLWDTGAHNRKYGSTYDAYVGHSKKFGWFALMKTCGNLATKITPPPPPPPPPPPVKVSPTAACSGLQTPMIRNRTLVQLTGSATTSGGATVSKYTFTIKDSKGSLVTSKSVLTNKLSASADSFTVANPGTYTASLSITTSVGEKTDAKLCVKSFAISPPEVCSFNPALPASSPECQPCSDDSPLWIKDEKCIAQIIQTKSARNLTQANVDATTVIAQASDRIAYTITVKNIGLAAATVSIDEKLSDVLEYAAIFDNGGGTFDDTTKTLSWQPATLKPGEEQAHIFVVELKNEIPTVGQGTSDLSSFDCIITNTFGNSVAIHVNCPAPKQLEQVVAQLPHTGASENMIFAGIILSLATYFYARTRQVKKEVRLIRHDLNAGTI